MDKLEELRKRGEMLDLLEEDVIPIRFAQFFDARSIELLDEKIEVLKALKDGKTISEIPNFYKVLELLPPDGELWD